MRSTFKEPAEHFTKQAKPMGLPLNPQHQLGLTAIVLYHELTHSIDQDYLDALKKKDQFIKQSIIASKSDSAHSLF